MSLYDHAHRLAPDRVQEKRRYRVPGGDKYHPRLARDLQKKGAMRHRLVWVIHRISTSIITIDRLPDYEQFYTPGEDVLGTLRDLDPPNDDARSRDVRSGPKKLILNRSYGEPIDLIAHTKFMRDNS